MLVNFLIGLIGLAVSVFGGWVYQKIKAVVSCQILLHILAATSYEELKKHYLEMEEFVRSKNGELTKEDHLFLLDKIRRSLKELKADVLEKSIPQIAPIILGYILKRVK